MALKTAQKNRQKPLTLRQKLVAASAQQRKVSQDLVFHWQEKLFSAPFISHDVLQQAATVLQPQSYQEIIEERSVQGQCGYPLCEKTLPSSTHVSRYRISLSQRKVYDLTDMAMFCSQACLQKSRYYSMQLSEEPVWGRDSTKPVHVHVVLAQEDIKQAVQKEKERMRVKKTTPQLQQEYVQLLVQSLQNVAVGGLEIKETTQEQGRVRPLDMPQAESYATIEGFVMQPKKNEPLTMTLKKQKAPSVRKTVKRADTPLPDRKQTTADMPLPDRKQTTADMPLPDRKQTTADTPLPDRKQKTALPTSTHHVMENTTAPTTAPTTTPKKPKKPKKSKKSSLPQMSLFGMIWTLLDAISTPTTYDYFRHLHGESVHNINYTQGIARDEASLMREQIFCEKILQTQIDSSSSSNINNDSRIKATLENDMADLIRTFHFPDASKVALASAQAYMMTLVLFKAIADRLLVKKEKKEEAWKEKFEACCHSVGQSTETVDACVRVIVSKSTYSVGC
ncbi:Rtr1/RPAP2 family-domain-containing protein [Spinellus fusiger]|nr:Rtr1/RPAP2 family-domain-containing protein [Spinellus fusiger]